MMLYDLDKYSRLQLVVVLVVSGYFGPVSVRQRISIGSDERRVYLEVYLLPVDRASVASDGRAWEQRKSERLREKTKNGRNNRNNGFCQLLLAPG